MKKETSVNETNAVEAKNSSSKEEEFLALSKEYEIKKENYKKEVQEREEKIRLMKERIKELEKEEEMIKERNTREKGKKDNLVKHADKLVNEIFHYIKEKERIENEKKSLAQKQNELVDISEIKEGAIPEKEEIVVNPKTTEVIEKKTQPETESFTSDDEETKITEVNKKEEPLKEENEFVIENEKIENIEKDQIPATENVVENENTELVQENKEGQVIIDKATDKIIENLSGPEKKLLEEVMKEEIPLPFESPKVKTSLRTFLQNQVVKNLSGLVTSKKIKGISHKVVKNLLMITAVVSLWPKEAGGYYSTPNNDFNKNKITILKESDLIKDASLQYSLTTAQFETYNKLPRSVQSIYLYAIYNTKESYMVADKPSATMYVIGKNKEIIASFPILLGQTKGEEPNRADPDSDVAKQATTPAGKYKLGEMADPANVCRSDSIEYKGRIISVLGTDNIAVHMVYPGEYVKRMKALNDGDPSNNRMSWGCINVDPDFFDKFIKPNFKGKDHLIFITPDIAENNNVQYALNPETGKLAIDNGLNTKEETQLAKNENSNYKKGQDKKQQEKFRTSNYGKDVASNYKQKGGGNYF